MDFIKYISTLTTYSEDNPLITSLKLTRGRLTGGFVYFPTGPAGLLHFIARIGVHQIVPFNTGDSYRLNDCVVQFHLNINLTEEPFVIDCVTWNDSTTYSHALTVCFYLSPRSKRNKEIDDLATYQNLVKGYHKP